VRRSSAYLTAIGFTPNLEILMGIIGSQIKPFKANAFQAGKDFFEVTQDDIAGKWAVFFFYPADFTFVCPTELEDLGEHYDMLQKMGVEVYGVSTDTHFAHKAWHDTSERIGKLKFAFLGDQLHTLSKNFDVLREDMGLADRATFVIDPDGVIQIMEQTCEGVGRNANELTRKIKAAQYVRNNPGQVCPAAWEEGSDTLAPSLDLVGKILSFRS
jgi:peroxiredoxin (alkyl hydroperoxide reductase subunit C)